MKKTITLALALVLALSLLAACGGKDNGGGGQATTPPTNSDSGQAAPPDSTPSEQPADDSQSADSGSPSFDWPDSKWTQHMPKPAGALTDVPTEDVEGSAASTCWFVINGGRDDAKAYVEQLLAYGYTENPEPLVVVEETDREWRWDGISPAIDEVYHYYISVHHFVPEYGDGTTYDIIISDH